MKEITKKQKIFMALYPLIQLILFIPIAVARMGSAVGNPNFLGFDFIIKPLFLIFVLPFSFIHSFVDKTFFSLQNRALVTGLTIFIYIVYAYFLGFVFVVLYKIIRNR